MIFITIAGNKLYCIKTCTILLLCGECGLFYRARPCEHLHKCLLFMLLVLVLVLALLNCRIFQLAFKCLDISINLNNDIFVRFVALNKFYNLELHMDQFDFDSSEEHKRFPWRFFHYCADIPLISLFWVMQTLITPTRLLHYRCVSCRIGKCSKKLS